MRTAAICPTCATYENAICVLYDGPYLPCTGISPLDSIAEALAKIDAAICALGGTTTTSTTTTAGPTTSTTTSSTSSTTTSSTSSTSTTTTSTTAGPTTTTTTTTSCLAGLTQQILITQVNESPGGTIYILPTPIGEACALLPNIQAGSVPILNSTFPERLDGQLFIGANIIYDNCNPVASGTYALYADPLSGVTTFIEVTDGVITDIVNCSTTTTTTTVAPTTTTTTTAL